jgi:hypothetical protein
MTDIFVLINELSNKYNAFDKERTEYYKTVCNGGNNFSKTLEFAPINDEETIKSAYECLETIVNFPNAGSISWEMRRYLRRCPSNYVKIFFDEIKELSKLNNKMALDMDGYYYNATVENNNCQKESFEVIYSFSNWFTKSWFAKDNKNEEMKIEFQKRLEELEPELFCTVKNQELKEKIERDNLLKKL